MLKKLSQGYRASAKSS